MAIKHFGKIHYSKEVDSWIITELEPHVCIRLKKIFPSIAVTATVPYLLSNKKDVAADLYWFMQRYRLEISEHDRQLLSSFNDDYFNEVNAMESIMLPDSKFPPIQLINDLNAREYQTKAAELFKLSKRFLLGDDIGLGKTLTGILPLYAISNCTPAIIVVQTHLPRQWQAEIKRFTGIDAHFINKTKLYSLPKAPVYIIKYSMLHAWVDVFDKGFFKYACFDEAQELRRADSRKYQAAEQLANNVEYCMALTATPIYNYGFEIFNVLNIIKPGCLGTRMEFIREWCGGAFRNDDKIKVTDPKALGTYLRENFLLIRRTRQEVGRELPPINRLVYDVEYDQKEAEKSTEIARTIALRVKHGTFVERGQAARDLDAFVRHETGLVKAKSVAAFVKILLDNGKPVLLAGWHRDVYSIWMEELSEYKPVMFTGSETPAQKDEAKRKFIGGESSLMIISLRSGIGLDGLQKICNDVVIGELDWSPQVHDQLIGRVDREGQNEQVSAYFLTCDFGSDPIIVDLLGLKSTQSHNIVNPNIAMGERFSDESRIQLMAERFLNHAYALSE